MLKIQHLSFVVILLLFSFNSEAWDKQDYPNSKPLSSAYKLYWRIEFENDLLHVALEVQTLGWVAFGLGELTSGSMPGSDIVVINFSEVGAPIISDRYATDFVMPLPDVCQDWKLYGFQRDPDTGVTVVELQRKLVTEDKQDRPIVAGMNKVVYAYGLDNEITIAYHEERRGSVEVIFYPDPNAPEDPEVEFIDEFTIGDFTIPSQETNYICRAFPIPLKEGDPDHHVVRIDPVMDPRAEEFTHHMLIHVCEDNSPLSHVRLYLDNPGPCISPIGNPVSGCSSLLFGWAMGGGSVILPPDAGGRMGFSEDAFPYMVMEIHYDNPNHRVGVVDNSGFRIHYTSKMRKYDAGAITLGDPFLQLPPIPPGQTAAYYETSCPSECTSQWPHEIHIFTSSAHMHKIGSMQWTTQYRDEQLIATTNRAEYFQFDFQQLTYVDIVVKPGDRLNTHCVWNSRDRTRQTRMGGGSEYEMCMDFISYYPLLKVGNSKKEYAYCGYFAGGTTFCGPMTFDGTVLPVKNPVNPDIEFGLNRTFGIPCQ